MKSVAILGSTGSIGSQALDVVRRYPERFRLSGLAARGNVALLARQANEFKPDRLSVGSPELIEALSAGLTYTPRSIGWGPAGLLEVAGASDDCMLAATDGIAALEAVLSAIERGTKTIALANKELAVAAGVLLFAAARRSGSTIVPVDSEHSAAFQCLAGERREDVAGIVLTASGGPCWELSPEQMNDVTPAQALAHPTWAMGAKNTIDSATMMNKGLEVIEASYFFGIAPEHINIVVHRQSIAHAFVAFKDGSLKAQLAWPDMKTPIGFALAYPERLPDGDGARTLAAIGLGGKAATLTFEPLDNSRFPAVGLCYRALRAGGTYPAVLSAANEEAGRAFLQGKVKFTDISALVERSLEAHAGGAASLADILRADAWARETTLESIAQRRTV